MEKVIVTGSEGLIGKEVCRYLLDKGFSVTRCDKALGIDLSDENCVKDWFRNNRADYLINLFAINDHIESGKKGDGLFDISLGSFNDYLEVNLTALFSVCREFARNNSKGGIVNFSSIYGVGAPYPDIYNGGHKHIGYCVSKAGVIELTKYLAVYLAPHIRVNCIVPGGVCFKQGQEFVNSYSSHVPAKRMMESRELNTLVEYFCSEGSSYTTGAVFHVDGGWTAW